MAIVVYTVLRIAVFLGIWMAVNLLTPIHGVWAAVVALLVSGAISLVLLDRQRGRVGVAAAGFFGRLNERIEASARAEDDDEDPDASSLVAGLSPPEVATSDDASEGSSGEGEQGSERQAVDEQELPGELERRDEGWAEGAAPDDADRTHGQQSRQ